jgi:Uma2 family endonuclease
LWHRGKITVVSPAEYLELERKAERKSEYLNGEMFLMAGASPRHGVIVTNLVAELRQQLKARPCIVYSSDVRLRVSPSGLYTYPDVMVVCGEPQFAGDQKDTVLNPNLIVEVLSDSTRDYDRGEKFQHYRTLSSLREYLTIAQDAPHIERWTRQPEDHWLLTEFSDLSQSVQLTSVDCDLSLTEVYDKVVWAA